MNRSTSNINGTLLPSEPVGFYGEWHVRVIRHDGRIEEKILRNTVTAAGLNRIANRAVQATGTTPFAFTVIGTRTTAAADTDVQSNMGEILRKPWIASGASAQSREWVFGVVTVGGAADSVTSKTMDCAGICDFANSHATTGIIGNRVTGLGVTLADSDFMNLTVRIRCGSHNQAHST